jgi:hypothetical protein
LLATVQINAVDRGSKDLQCVALANCSHIAAYAVNIEFARCDKKLAPELSGTQFGGFGFQFFSPRAVAHPILGP